MEKNSLLNITHGDYFSHGFLGVLVSFYLLFAANSIVLILPTINHIYFAVNRPYLFIPHPQGTVIRPDLEDI